MQSDVSQFVRKFRVHALFCALAVLIFDLVSRPFAEMGICDDWSYNMTAQLLAATGHVVYNGWSTPMGGWQLYLGAAFIKLLGPTFLAVRMSTLFVAVLTAFLLQRTLVRAGIHERNATLGTLTLVLSPLYLVLSVTFMTDIAGIFPIVFCLYSCLRALQAGTSRSMAGWLCFAALSNALLGTVRQVAWLGVFVMVPCTLWLVWCQQVVAPIDKNRRRIALAGALACVAGGLFALGCIHWYGQQPYSISEHILGQPFHVRRISLQFGRTLLDVPFLLLPLTAAFLPGLRRSSRAVLASVWALTLICVLLARHAAWLEPTLGQFVSPYGIYDGVTLQGEMPFFLPHTLRLLFTFVSIGGLLGLIALIAPLGRGDAAWKQRPDVPSAGASWKQLAVLLGPFTAAYTLLLVAQAAIFMMVDRYILALLVVLLLCLVRFYQERVQPRLPAASVVLIGVMAVYGIAVTHDLFSFYRARIALAAELRAGGVPDTSVDNGWEYNSWVELQHAGHVNDRRIAIPAHIYTPGPALPAGLCHVAWYDSNLTPQIHPLYGISFDPTACLGPAPFAPVRYDRWPARPGTLYVVRYTDKASQASR